MGKRRKSQQPAAPSPPQHRWLPWMIAAGLAVLVALTFAEVRHHDFVDFDDGLYVIENTNVRGGLTLENVAWAFTTGRAANWHPLTWMSHQLDVSLFGMNAGLHHVTNVFWHALNTVLLFGLLRSMTGATIRSAIVAALFAVHPAHVESVAWISERKDVLSTFFLIGGTWFWTVWTRTASSKHWMLAFAAFALGLMSKPMLMTLPFVWLLLDVWPLGRSDVPWRRRVTEKLPFFALAVASLVVTVIVQQQGGAVATLETVTAGERVANAIAACGYYLRMLFWPVNLAAFYPYARSIPAAVTAGAAALLLAVSFLAWRLRNRAGFVLIGWLWFLGTLVPVLGLIQIGMQSHADRYTYVPYIGLFIAIVWGAAALAGGVSIAKRAATGAGVAAIAACAVLAHAQVRTWKNSEALWTHAIAAVPGNAKAHNSLGAIYGNTGRVAEAEAQFKEALRLRPDLTEGLHIYPNLGRSLVAQGKLTEAIPYLERARQLKPDDASIASELGTAYMAVDRIPDAIIAWRASLRLNPKQEHLWFMLGISLAAGGQVSEARQAFTEVLRINPARQDAAIALERLR